MSATPRTDKAANESIVAVYEESKRLETELAAVTKQRDELAEVLRNILADARLALPTIKAAVEALKSIEP